MTGLATSLHLHSPRVRFGPVRDIAADVAELGYHRVLIIAGSHHSDTVAEIEQGLRASLAGVFTGIRVHVPETVINSASEYATNVRADCCLAIGGGSATGLGKILALEGGLPLIAVPTTYSGSEMTPVWGCTRGEVKQTGRDLRVLPELVVYDAGLTRSMPARLSAASGLNAMAHAVEALYAENANPLLSAVAAESIGLLSVSLQSIVADPQDGPARESALYGAWMAGFVLAWAGLALHHKLCHVIGGVTGLPHADIHAVMLAYSVEFNQSAVPAAMARLEQAMGAGPAAHALHQLTVALGLPTSLRDLGVSHASLGRIAELSVANPYFNPREVTRAGIRDLLERAFQGAIPGTPPQAWRG